MRCDKSISSILLFANSSLTALTDTREASQLFSYVKQAAESGALDLDERAEDVTGGCRDEFQCNVMLSSHELVSIWVLTLASLFHFSFFF